MGETHPCRVNRAKVMVVTATLVHHIEAKVVEMKLASETNKWPSMGARARYMQRNWLMDKDLQGTVHIRQSQEN